MARKRKSQPSIDLADERLASYSCPRCGRLHTQVRKPGAALSAVCSACHKGKPKPKGGAS